MSGAGKPEPLAGGYVAGAELLVRTPLLPLDRFLEWGEGLSAVAAEPTARHAQIQADKRLLRQRLVEYCQDPVVEEALYVASPSLHEALQKWDRDTDSRSSEATTLAVTRYFTRMTSRCTPFGLFSSSSMGRCGEGGGVMLGDRDSCRRHVRVDTERVIALTAALEKRLHIRSRLRFRPTDALVAWPDRVSFPAVDPGAGRSYSLVALDADAALCHVLSAARSGQTLGELARLLQSEDATFEEARDYCSELVESGVLCSELQPSVWGEEPLEQVAAVLRKRAPEAHETRLVEEVLRQIDVVERLPMGTATAGYGKLEALLRELSSDAEKSHALQVDLARPLTSSSLPSSVLEDLANALRVLERLSERPRGGALARFKADFERRFGNREVPLLEALDEERGVAYPKEGAENRDPAPLLEGLMIQRPRTTSVGSASTLDSTLLPHLVGIWQRGEREWALSPADVESLAPGGGTPLPDSLSVLFQLLAESPEALERGDYRIALQSCWGPSGAMLLGRFCHGDPAVEEAARAIVAREEALEPDALFAEISHVPEGRGGNVVCRPRLRAHHISYLGGGHLGEEGSIPASDLRVRLSGGRFVIRSAQLNRRIVVRLTTAHNHRNSGLAVYRFLCALQQDGLGHADLDWGSFRNSPFLPSVRVGRVVIAPATWRLSRPQCQPLGEATCTVVRFELVQRLRSELRLPRYVHLEEGDKKLFIDLDNALSVDALATAAKRQPFMLLMEASEPRQLGVVKGTDGAYVHELAVPFARQPRQGAAEPEGSRARGPSLEDTEPVSLHLTPGSEWLSLKFYGGGGDLENILREMLVPYVLAQQRAGTTQGWFFIRYRDPETHLRLRLHGDPNVLSGTVLPTLARTLQPLMQSGVLHRFEVDTYEREVERYGGGRGMVLSERVFEADSIATWEALRALEQAGLGDQRWQAVIVGIHHLLADFCGSTAAMLETVQEQRRFFGYEFGIGTGGERVLGQRFRNHRRDIEQWLSGDFHLPGVSEAYARRSHALAPLVAELKSLAHRGCLHQPLTGKSSMVASYAHMHAIRMFRSHTREQELLLYDFLARSYRSQLARKSRDPSGQTPVAES